MNGEGSNVALVRCSEHGTPKGKTNEYVRSVEPVGYPKTGVICGIVDCESSGLIWLNHDESFAYETGERIFRVASNAVKVKAK